MAITGLMAGANEQRGADTNYLAALDQMRRAAAAQALEQARLQQQQAQFGQEFGLRQAQQAQQNELERQRLAMQQAQFGQEFGLRQSADQRAAEQARQQGLASQFELGQKQQALGARNSLADLIAQNPDMSTKELGLAFLSQGGDISSGLNFLKASREEEAAARKEQQAAQQASRGEWKIFAPEGIRVNTITGEVQKLEGVTGASKATEDERKAAGWLAQATNAYNNMANVVAKTPGVEAPGILEAGAEALGFRGTANAFRSPERQQFVQAAKSFSEAALRAATGAGVTEAEARQKIEELTPQFTDHPEVRAQKLESMKIYLDSLTARAGRAAGSFVPERGNLQYGGGAEKPAAQSGKIKFLGFE